MDNHIISTHEARQDLKYILKNFGYPDDFCGGCCNTDMLIDLLLGKKVIKESIIEVIKYCFRHNAELKRSDDIEIETIKFKYNC